MRAFLLSLVVTLGLALTAALVIGGGMSLPADQAFSTESVRVGQGGSVAARRFSGGGEPLAY